MKVGQKIICKLYPEYEEGIILSKQNVFGKIFYKIFFENANKIIEVPKDDIKPIDNPLDLFKSHIFSNSIQFKLKFLAHFLDVIASGEEMISPSNFKINPLPHQLLVLDFVLNQFKPRCLLADEVGLGKTIEAALIMEELKLRNIVKRILIITPAGLTSQWKDELKIKFSEDFMVFNGANFKSLKEFYGKETNVWLYFNKVITSIDFLKPKKVNDDLSEKEKKRRENHNKSVFEDCVNGDWDMVIIDEAHKLTKHESGEETARYKIGKRLSDSVPVFLILTATPHKGKPYIFKNLLSLVDPYLFSKLEDLKPENVKQITIRNKKRATIDFSGNKLFKKRITTLCEIKWDSEIDASEICLYNKIVEYISEYYNYAIKENNHLMILLLMLYQRIVSSSSRAILKSLQNRLNTLEKIYQLAKKIKKVSIDNFTDLSGEEQLDFIDNLLPSLKNPELVKKEISIVSECIELARNATIGRSDAKLRKLINIIDDLKKSKNDKDIKILVFTEFKETQRYIIETLENIGYKTTFINGDLNLEQKILHKQKFQEEAQILISTDAGGEGINLQFCYIVINYDLPWNPMKIEQRIGRVDRIGQTKDVFAFNFILTDTIEEYVREKIEEKLKLVAIQFGDDKLSDILTSLNEEFQFDKIFFDYISKNMQKSHELDKISNQIYQRAKEILENDDLLIPFSDDKNIKDYKIGNIQRLSRKIYFFLTLFLKERKLELREYKNQNDVFFLKNDFRTDKFSNYYKKVIFNQVKGIDNEDAELFSLNHEYVKEIIDFSKNFGKTSRFIVKESKFNGNNGFLFNWIFSITNNINFERKYLIPVFIQEDEKYNRRISDYLMNGLDHINLKESQSNENIDIESFYTFANEQVNLIAENIFLEVDKEWNDKTISDKQKLEKYYLQKAKAVSQIKIDNIRLSKQKELRKEKHEKILDLKKQSNLFPHLDCIQIAKINFGVNLIIQNSWYAEIVKNILKPQANIVFIVDKPQILEFPPIKEEIKKGYPILEHFKSELELRLLLKKKKHKKIVIFKSEKEIPYDLMSKFIIFNIRHMLKEVFNKLDCKEILKFPIEIYQIIFENYNKMKDGLFEKMSKADTQKFIKNIELDDYFQKRNYANDIKSKIKNLIKTVIKNIDWGEISINLGELLYYIDNFNVTDDIIELKSELNDKFLKYIKEKYENLIYDTKSHINSNLINLIFGEDKKRNAIICFDCMGFEEWYVIKDFLNSKNGLDFKVGYSFSILPSETKYSSSAIFAGMVPKDIKELEIINQIHWKNEERLFKYALSTQYEIDKSEIYFKRCLKSNDIDFSFDNFKDYNAIGLVFSLIDDITHSRRRMNKKLLLKTIKIELEDSNLDDLIRNLLKQDFNIYFVSDHGNIFSYGNGINVSRNLFDSKAKRYLISNEKILLSEFKREIRDSLLIQFKNIIGNEYLLLLSGNIMFGSKNEASLTHGGISVEEVVVPFIKVMKK